MDVEGLLKVIGLALVLLVALWIVTGCSLAPTDQVVGQLAQSERSWCVSVTSVYGSLRMGGSGADGARVLCNQEGLQHDTSGQTKGTSGGVPVELAPVRLRMVPADR